MKLGIRLTIIISAVFLLAIVLSSYLFFNQGSKIIESRLQEQLGGVSELKALVLSTFLDGASDDVQSLAIDDDLIYYLEHFHYLNEEYSEEDEEEAEELVVEYLNDFIGIHNDFTEVFIIESDGKIDFSTIKSNEGKIKLNDLYFVEGLKGTFIKNFYYSLSEQAPALTISTPVVSNSGKVLGVVAGRINLQRISYLMEDRAGLGETGETYLVNNYNYAVINLKKSNQKAFSTTIHTVIVEKCLNDKSTTVQFLNNYKDYADEFVYGSYVWLPERDVCLITEFDRFEALAPIYELGTFIAIAALIILILVMLASFFLTRSITKPLVQLSDAAKKIGLGELNVKIDFTRKDEIGDLARVLTEMEKNLKESNASLLKSKESLTNEVKLRTNELDEKIEELEGTKAATLNMMEDLRDSMDKQKVLEKVKTEFLSVTSHELRTPITPMKAQLQMVIGEYFGKLTEEQTKSLNMVLRNATRLDTLIGDILDISKLQSGVMKFVAEKASFIDVVKLSVETMGLKAGKTNIKLDLKMDEIPEMMIDKDRLTQVVMNILNNAIKFSPENSTINIDVKNKKDHVLVSIKDKGIGIGESDLKRIFNPFEQADSSVSRKFEGSGLGLAICNGVVLRHGGKIWVESELNKGSTFFFTIPFDTHLDKEDTEVELFTVNKEATLEIFSKDLKTQGYSLIPEKTNQLVAEGYVKEDGRLRYDISLKQLETKGYIRKNEG